MGRENPEERDLLEKELEGAIHDEEKLRAEGVPSDALIAHEATTERLVEIMARQQGRALVSDSEGDIFDVAMGRYSNQVPNLGPWLKAYDGDTIKQERVSGDRIVDRPLLNVGVATQPEALTFLANNVAQGRGFVARFAAAVFNPLARREFMPGRDLTASDLGAWTSRITALLDSPLRPEPITIDLSEEAAAAFKAWGQCLESEADRIALDEGEDPRDAWFRKFAGKVLRIALLLHCLQSDGMHRHVVDLPTMEAATAWGDYLAKQNRCVGRILRTDPQLRIAERILTWIDRKDRQGTQISRSEVHQAMKGGGAAVQRVSDVNDPLAALVERGWMKPVGDQIRGTAAHQSYVARPDLSEWVARCRLQDAEVKAAAESTSDGRPKRW